ncbi:hypothetical protein ACFLTD_00825 [Elusimicrobiota bacterium]
MYKIRGFKIRFRKREILKILKYNSSKNTSISADLENLMQTQMEKAYELIFPSVIYSTFFIKNSEITETVKNEITLGSSKITKLITESYAFTLIAATIGSKLEEEVDRLKQKDINKALVLDAIGSEAVEQSANFVGGILREEAAKNECYINMRFSPGYGDWPVEASWKILKFIDMHRIDITISKDGILIPRKSITGITTWIPE